MESKLKDSSEVLAESISVVGSTFSSCASRSPSDAFLIIKAHSLVFNQNNLQANSDGSTLLDIQPTEQSLNIEGTDFCVLGKYTAPLLSITGSEGSKIEFYNCCFRHGDDVAVMEDVPMFMSVSNQGTVVMTSVCFDATKEESIKLSGSVVFECPDSSFGGGCECWVQASTVYSDSEKPISTTTDTESSSTTFVTDDPEAGSGGSSSAGLIAGVVVAVIVVIVIIIVVILLLLRRKSRTTGEEANGDQEFTEETITTLSDAQTTGGDMGEWSHTTEDNPLFASENFDDGNGFDDAFEEGGFFE